MPLRYLTLLGLLLVPSFFIIASAAIAPATAQKTLAILLSSSPLTQPCHEALITVATHFDTITELLRQYASSEEILANSAFSSLLIPLLQSLADILNRCRLIALIVIVKFYQAQTMLEVLLLVWLVAVLDGFAARKIATDTFLAPRPAISSVLQTLSVLLAFCMLSVLLFPALGLELAAVLLGLLTACAIIVWIRDFHRFG